MGAFFCIVSRKKWAPVSQRQGRKVGWGEGASVQATSLQEKRNGGCRHEIGRGDGIASNKRKPASVRLPNGYIGCESAEVIYLVFNRDAHFHISTTTTTISTDTTAYKGCRRLRALDCLRHFAHPLAHNTPDMMVSLLVSHASRLCPSHPPGYIGPRPTVAVSFPVPARTTQAHSSPEGYVSPCQRTNYSSPSSHPVTWVYEDKSCHVFGAYADGTYFRHLSPAFTLVHGSLLLFLYGQVPSSASQ